ASILLAVGISLLIIPWLMPEEEVYKQVGSGFNTGAWMLIFYARVRFQPDFDKLVSVDTRAQILFLRSFADEKISLWNTQRTSVFEPSLEARIGNYFSLFGPFIAVGAPKDRVPRLGALRVYLSDNEWQDVVVRWIQEAGVILILIGTTRWVNWEVKAVRDN